MTQRAYQYRFYPTEEQTQMRARTFGCVRYVYNWGLRLKTDADDQTGKRRYSKDLSAQWTGLKHQAETGWLQEVSSVSLQRALRQLDRACPNFFAGRGGYPQFHKKPGKPSATYAASAFKGDGENITLAKRSEPLNRRGSRRFYGVPSSVPVSKDALDRNHRSILVDAGTPQPPARDNPVGSDRGLTDAVILAAGPKFGTSRVFRKDGKRLAKTQRQRAKTQKGSKNQAKARLKVALIHVKIAERRSDFLYKLSTRLINEHQVIAVEGLPVKTLIRNHHLAQSICRRLGRVCATTRIESSVVWENGCDD